MRNCIDGRKEFYDDKLKRVEYVDDDQTDVTPLPAMVPVEWVRLEDVWRQFGQAFVDACIANRWKTTLSESPKWLAIPGLNPAEYPCHPGAVVILEEKNVFDVVLHNKVVGYFAGAVEDFFAAGRPKAGAVRLLTKTSTSSFGTLRKEFRARKSPRAVIITAETQDVLSLKSSATSSAHCTKFPTWAKKGTLLSLDNFAYTGIRSRKCYVVSQVVRSSRLTLEFTLNGEIFYETVYDVPVPICFQLHKVHTEKGSYGVLKSVTPLTKKPHIHFGERSEIDRFIRPMVPNQSRYGPDVGDNSPDYDKWREPRVRQSLRRSGLGKDDIKLYFDTQHEYSQLRHVLGEHANSESTALKTDEKTPQSH
ncbi:uncharacterized protein LOC127879109 isoform X2 [Dreissena polymorpha]|uniref:uncharacterized protein LOC127879109 isoform X2 n=1 Tax=Dreissena polymorpha TaxID=45954 RepID=UPI0022651CAC|nr:uncharacterized protein LOC127879109 isoform X2 [Dreissena polymorpha]